MISTLVYFCVLAFAGVGITYSTGIAMAIDERVGVGVIVGAMVSTVLAFAGGWLFGFGTVDVIGSAFGVSVLSVPGWRVGATVVRSDIEQFRERIRRPVRDPDSARPAAGLCVASWALMFLVLNAAYRRDDAGTLVAGHLSTYGDWNAHLAYAGSFAFGENFPPRSPLADGSSIAYHVMVNVFGASSMVLGAAPTTALVLTSGCLGFAFPLVFLFAARQLCGSEWIAALSYVIFALAGGLGWVAAVGDVVRTGPTAVLHPIRSYSRMTEHAIWFDNPVLSYLFAQRPGLVGLPVVLIAVGCSFSLRHQGANRQWCALGVLVGMSAGFSVYGCTTAIGFAAWSTWRAGRGRVAFLLPAVALAAPTIVALRPETTDIRWLAGWMAATTDTPWIWFWFINVGVILPLAIVAFVRGDALTTGADRWFTVPTWAIFVAMNLVVLQPWEWNNTHYLISWLMMLSFPAAGILARLFVDRRIWLRVGAGAVALAAVASGALDVWGATGAAEFSAPLASADGVDAAEWARGATAPDAVFVVAPVFNEPVMSLGARRVVSGFRGWTFDLGVSDWAQRADASETILAGGAGIEDLIARYEVDYVVIGDEERGLPDGADQGYWDRAATLVYENATYRIYEVEA